MSVVFLGALMPVCCVGSLPIAVTLKKKGASLGCVLAFLIATPATSLSAVFACWKLLGGALTVYLFFTVVLMGLLIGLIGNRIPEPKLNSSAVGADSS
jgi:uncharacterized membrane protein YraQ (UPF0718 family)